MGETATHAGGDVHEFSRRHPDCLRVELQFSNLHSHCMHGIQLGRTTQTLRARGKLRFLRAWERPMPGRS